MDKKRYFAALPSKEILAELFKKVENFDQNTLMSGLYNRMRKSFRMYYGYSGEGNHASSKVTFGGDSGELALIKVNEFRNLIQHLLVLTTQSKPVMDCKAINTDYKSQVQAILASGILEYYMREKRLDRVIRNAVEMSLVLSEGWIGMFWDPSAGEMYGVNPDTGMPVNEGDIQFENLTPMDVIRDIYKESNAKLDWTIVRRFRNKYDLIAKYPEFEDRILNINTKDLVIDKYKMLPSFDPESDDVPVYEFFHKPTAACPLGRHVIFLTNEISLHDGNLPYRNIPLYRIAPSEVQGSIFGYTVAFDLMGPQEVVDSLISAVTTNQNAFAVQNIWIKPGGDINYTAISEGMNVIESAEKPEPLQMCATSPETFTFIDIMLKRMETISGVNSVARGNPESSLKSGSALALVASQAIQFSNGLQQAYSSLVEDVGTGLINILKDFAVLPRMAMVAGKNKKLEMKQFTGDDIKDVSRVHVELGNPLSRTVAGREQIANNLMQMGMVKNPEAYFQVLETGRLEPIIEGDQAEYLLIKSENERLSTGEKVVVVATDKHPLHIQEHKVVLAQPESRNIPEVVAQTLAHIQDHIISMQTTDPNLLMLIGVSPLPPPVMPTAPTIGGVPSSEPVLNAQNPTEVMAQSVGQPRMPTNPLTGNQYDQQSGGLNQ